MTDESSKYPDRRGDDRRTALKGARIVHAQGSIECKVRNISEGGARLDLGTQQLLPHTFELHITGLPVKQCSLRWTKDNLVGVTLVSDAQ